MHQRHLINIFMLTRPHTKLHNMMALQSVTWTTSIYGTPNTNHQGSLPTSTDSQNTFPPPPQPHPQPQPQPHPPKQNKTKERERENPPTQKNNQEKTDDNNKKLAPNTLPWSSVKN